ncbi:hypothetical protein JOL62DRAFT_608953 [Phyllosticta paracitricarpa]|uniref:Uncharacterized protein n=1 Tax=Phyllosticta paracitricarpa TaxID=2016321 RepID=A0ABR1NIY1_9PEZI
MATQTSILDPNPHLNTVYKTTPTPLDADGVPKYTDSALADLLTEACRLQILKEMPQNEPSLPPLRDPRGADRDEAGYGVYNTNELNLLLTEAYRLLSIYELLKTSRPADLTLDFADLAPMHLFVRHYDPEGLFLRIKLASTPFSVLDECLEHDALLLKKGQQFVDGTFKRWSWDDWSAGQKLPLDALQAIARERRLIERRTFFAAELGSFGESDKTSEGSNPPRAESLRSWAPGSEGGSNKTSEGSGSAGGQDQTFDSTGTTIADFVGSWKLKESEMESVRGRDETSKENHDAIVARLDALGNIASAIRNEVLSGSKVNPEHVVRDIGPRLTDCRERVVVEKT